MKYFCFQGTINGVSYLLRFLVNMILIPLFGIGIYLLAVTGYKRASALTKNKFLIYSSAFFIPILTTYNFIGMFQEGLVWLHEIGGASLRILVMLSGVLHLFLIFKDSSVQNHNG